MSSINMITWGFVSLVCPHSVDICMLVYLLWFNSYFQPDIMADQQAFNLDKSTNQKWVADSYLELKTYSLNISQ